MDVLTTATARDVRDRSARIAALPVGSFEQHGEHLPLVTDTLIAGAVASEISAAYGLLLLPPLTFGCSHEHAGLGATVSISAATLYAAVNDIAGSLRRDGVDRLVVVNGHGGNYVLSNVVQEANERDVRMTLFPGRADWDAARAAAGLETGGHEDMHAGELETSVMLHAFPALVGGSYQRADHQATNRPHLLALGLAGYTQSGVIGRPSLASADKGKLLLDYLTQAFDGHHRLLRA